MAGTTVRDDGSVLAAFSAAIAAQNLPAAAYHQAMTDVRSSMGQSKIEVFRRILGDEHSAQRANEAFEEHYAGAVRAGHVAALPGATYSRRAGTRESGSAWPPASPPPPGTPSLPNSAGDT
jgi:hypothetical protein